jgi:NAD(P)-dependent dehydrogenase (short-subunit alcohol dehydrogenase family)
VFLQLSLSVPHQAAIDIERLAGDIPGSNTPDDIANMAAFLASDEARNITGQSFNVDGGLMWD